MLAFSFARPDPGRSKSEIKQLLRFKHLWCFHYVKKCGLGRSKDRILRFSQFFLERHEIYSKATPGRDGASGSFKKCSCGVLWFQVTSTFVSKLHLVSNFEPFLMSIFRTLRCFAMDVHVFRVLRTELVGTSKPPPDCIPLPPIQC